MKIWKNTSTLDGYDNGLQFTDSKNDAIIALLGSKRININNFPIHKAIFREGIKKGITNWSMSPWYSFTTNWVS